MLDKRRLARSPRKGCHLMVPLTTQSYQMKFAAKVVRPHTILISTPMHAHLLRIIAVCPDSVLLEDQALALPPMVRPFLAACPQHHGGRLVCRCQCLDIQGISLWMLSTGLLLIQATVPGSGQCLMPTQTSRDLLREPRHLICNHQLDQDPGDAKATSAPSVGIYFRLVAQMVTKRLGKLTLLSALVPGIRQHIHPWAGDSRWANPQVMRRFKCCRSSQPRKTA